MKHLMLGNGWDVFHRDDIWMGTLRQAGELIQESPFSFLAIWLVALCIGRERLARGASSENLQVSIAEESIQFSSGDLADVLLYELGAVVSLIRKAASRIHVDASNDWQA